MNEEARTPYVDWEYCVVTEDGELNEHPRIRAAQLDRIPPGSGWQIEFRGQTRHQELLVASYQPSADENAREWLEAFGSGTLRDIPVSIDAYFGPKIDPPTPDDDPKDADAYFRSLGRVEEPEPVEHFIYIGHGRATWEGNALHVSIPPEVFRDAGASVLSALALETEFADIDQRIYQIFTLIDPSSFQRFLRSMEDVQILPTTDAKRLIDHPLEPTYSRVPLLPDQLISVFARENGVISHQQLYLALRTTSRSLKGWLKKAELLDAGQRRLTGWLFTTRQLLDDLVPRLRKNRPTYGTDIFIRLLTEAKIIPR